MANILINNCGSQAVEIIKLLKQDTSNCVVYLTYTDKEKYEDIADVVLEDYKDLGLTTYVEFLLNLCEKYAIDVFIPFNSMVSLIAYKDKIERTGVKVLACDNTSMFNVLNSKTQTYKLLGPALSDYIPLYVRTKTFVEFRNACQFIRDKGLTVCVKYAVDIAANSFRILNFDRRSLSELDVKGTTEAKRLAHMLDYNVLLDMLMTEYGVDEFDEDLMVMEYLEGKEVSCDCLKLDDRNIVVVRYKETSTTQRIIHDEEIESVCNTILNATGYTGPCNIQFKYDRNGKLKLLEVNTRMSGGIMISSWATGINLPLIAVKKLLGTLTDEDLVKVDYTEKVYREVKGYEILDC